MKVIDFRFRPCVKAVVDSIVSNPVFSGFVAATGFGSKPAPTLAEEVALFKSLGVEKVVMNGRDCETVSRAPSSNPGVIEAMSAFPDEIIGFYGFDPYKGMDGVRAFRKAIQQEGFVGASVDADICRLPLSDARFYPLYTMCCDLGVPVIMTTGAAPMPGVPMENTSPVHVDRVAAHFPELKIVMSHAAWNYPYEALSVVYRNNNVYMDISDMNMIMWMDIFVKAINSNLGNLSDKVFFGSAHPFMPLAEALETMAGFEFADGVREKIMYGNAKRFLGLA
ncbi:amidohydrolase family protein [Desulfovibrio sp. OttesenSCG-928-C06]|nr:amidohydrolase family protein [Desulfovibrio sp. OttesenSCG-928-C06]